MEATSSKISGHEGEVKEEKGTDCNFGEEEKAYKVDEMLDKVYDGKRNQTDYNIRLQSPNGKEVVSGSKQDNELELAKAEMDKVRQENQRLKMYLDQLMMDYKNLQSQFQKIVHHDQSNKLTDHKYQKMEPELLSLSLGTSSSSDIKMRDIDHKKVGDKEDGLVLGLDCKTFKATAAAPSLPNYKVGPAESFANASFENSLEDEEGANEETKERLTSHEKNSMKTTRPAGDEDEGISQQNPTKRARVSVRVRCDTPTMNDGCQWRKYGQKIAKGNPCPRAYYRCTVAPSCPVRKQVQRCSDDMSILISTYEGTHNHPLPNSATAMASTTSAAAVMLLSGSSSSDPNSSSNATSSTTNNSGAQLHGLGYYLSNSKPPFYLPNNSSASSCPTITLDLASHSSSSHFNLMPNSTARYNNINPSSTNLSFSSLDPNNLPISWSYGNSNNSTQMLPPYYKNSLNFGRHIPQDNVYQYSSYMQKNSNVNNNNNNVAGSSQPDSIEAATKAITSDPSFQSAIAAALSSIISGQNVNNLEQTFPVLSSFSSTENINSQLQANGNFRSPPLPVSSSKSKSTSPEDSRHRVR